MENTIYLNNELSTTLLLPYDNLGRKFAMSKQLIVRAMKRDQGLDSHHQKVFDTIPDRSDVRLEGTGYGWWTICGPNRELEAIIDQALASTSFCRVGN